MPASDVLSLSDIDEFRALVTDLAFPDTCEIRREISAGTDDFGNALPSTTATVEAGPCALRSVNQQSQERIFAERLGWAVPFAIDLPFGTIVDPKDTVRVNGARTFEVGGVVKEGVWGITATAIVDERG